MSCGPTKPEALCIFRNFDLLLFDEMSTYRTRSTECLRRDVCDVEIKKNKLGISYGSLQRIDGRASRVLGMIRTGPYVTYATTYF